MIQREHAHLFVAAATHAGMSGKNNEDCYTIIAHQISAEDATPSVFAVVADGIGGHRAGEIAAQIAVDIISHAVASSDASNPTQILADSITQASTAIHNQSQGDDAQDGMGSTAACAWVIGDRLFTASVGDSRIYLLREGLIYQLSTDHTWVQEAIEHGIIQREQARGHPRAHVIRRYLGAKSPPEVDFRLRLHPEEIEEDLFANQGMLLRENDTLFLCSDGLTDLVDDHEIAAALQIPDLNQPLNDLIDLANQRGGHDNITVVALRVPPPGQSPAGISKPKSKSWLRRKPWLTCLGIWVIVAAILALIATAAWYVTRPDPTPTLTPDNLPAIMETIAPPTDAPTNLPPTHTQAAEPGVLPLQATLTPWPTATQSP